MQTGESPSPATMGPQKMSIDDFDLDGDFCPFSGVDCDAAADSMPDVSELDFSTLFDDEDEDAPPASSFFPSAAQSVSCNRGDSTSSTSTGTAAAACGYTKEQQQYYCSPLSPPLHETAMLQQAPTAQQVEQAHFGSPVATSPVAAAAAATTPVTPASPYGDYAISAASRLSTPTLLDVPPAPRVTNAMVYGRMMADLDAAEAEWAEALDEVDCGGGRVIG